MELKVLYVVEIAGKKHYFASAKERSSFIAPIWQNHPFILITEYEITLK